VQTLTGARLEGCDGRAEVNTIKKCKDRCDAHNDCLSFNYAPPNAKDHAKVCTLYDKAEPTHTFKDELVFCARTHYKLAVSGAYCQKRWWLGNPAHGIPNLDACAVAAAKNQHCHGKYFHFHDYGSGGGGNCQCVLDLCPEAGTTGQAASNSVYRLLKPMGFHGQGHCTEGHSYQSKAWELATSTVGEQGFETCLPRGRKERGRGAERRIRRPSSSAFGRMRVTDATAHPHALHLATPMYRPGSLCNLCSSGHVTEGRLSRVFHGP